MRKRLHIALMASTFAATSLFHALLRADEGGDGSSDKVTRTKITASDERGRKIYVNDPVAATPRRTEASDAPRRTLKYWSPKGNRWKPVPPPDAAVMRAARSAAARSTSTWGMIRADRRSLSHDRQFPWPTGYVCGY